MLSLQSKGVPFRCRKLSTGLGVEVGLVEDKADELALRGLLHEVLAVEDSLERRLHGGASTLKINDTKVLTSLQIRETCCYVSSEPLCCLALTYVPNLPFGQNTTAKKMSTHKHVVFVCICCILHMRVNS